MKLDTNWSSDLSNSLSPAYLNLANNVKKNLLPKLRNRNPSIADIEITGFQQGKLLLLMFKQKHKIKCHWK